jgi:hypothetical protein
MAAILGELKKGDRVIMNKIIALITDRIRQLQENEPVARNAKDYMECLHSHYGIIELERILKILEK